jgi:Tfp pilus assembly protein PilO
MARVKVTLSLFLSVTVLVVTVVGVLQYNSYFNQRYQLLQQDEENRRLLKAIEPVRQRQELFYRELAETRLRYDDLRRQIPAELQLEAFKRQLERQFQKRGLAVLAQREARYNRPSYQEVKLSYSLKGHVSSVQQVVKHFRTQARLVISSGAEKESDKNTGLALSVFSAPIEEPVVVTIPAFIDEPEDTLLPFLNEELGVLYEDYFRTCRVLEESKDVYRDMQQYRHLSESVQQLEKIRDSLTQLQ